MALQLLIVPYGIETLSFFVGLHGLMLLIVPYGIETHSAEQNNPEQMLPFNRTLWN